MRTAVAFSVMVCVLVGCRPATKEAAPTTSLSGTVRATTSAPLNLVETVRSAGLTTATG